MSMRTITFNGKTYRIDAYGFLIYPEDWDEGFARCMAHKAGIKGELGPAHWKMIHFIRNEFERMHACPLVYISCLKNEIGLGDMKKLFPAGYLRGVCRLAGITYRQGYFQQTWFRENIVCNTQAYENKSYFIDIEGFLNDPADWDENFALHRAYELKMPEYLSPDHWQLMNYVRDRYDATRQIPMPEDFCRDNDITPGDFEWLFPDGYYRGLIRLAGLKSENSHREAFLKFDNALYNGFLVSQNENISQGADIMGTLEYGEKTYEVDEKGFLSDFRQWDDNFARGSAAKAGMNPELSTEQWQVIRSIRKSYQDTGRCPIVYETCRTNGLRLDELRRLFPTGYLRGACKLAGITYKVGYLGQTYMPSTAEDLNHISADKVYEVDVRGFLIRPEDWDEYYAAYRAFDMKIPGGKLTDDHWRIIRFMRSHFAATGVIPNIYETCEKNGLSLSDLEKLFPDGYHRGAVKIAGLRAL